jgi:hypothetical protein
MLTKRNLFEYCAGAYLLEDVPDDINIDDVEFESFIDDNISSLYDGYRADYIIIRIKEDMRALNYWLKSHNIEVAG